jgi:hypothetical protein
MNTVGRYRGHPYRHVRVRVVFPHAETNPLLWVAYVPDSSGWHDSDVFGWYDTRRAMEADIDDAVLDELLAEAE